jgi:hypothetical protein
LHPSSRLLVLPYPSPNSRERDTLAYNFVASTVAGDVTTSIVPTVQGSFLSMAASFQTAMSTIVPVVTGTAMKLSATEMQTLVADLNTIKGMVGGVTATVKNMAGTVAGGGCS